MLKIYHAKIIIRARVAILIAHRVDLKVCKVLNDEEGHYIMINGSVVHEDQSVLKIYVSNKVSRLWWGKNW